MKTRRFILAFLLSVCLGCFSVSSVFAYTATKSNSERDVVVVGSDELDIDGNMLMSVRNNLLAASGSIAPVDNTINLSAVNVSLYSSSVHDENYYINGSYKSLSSSGSYSFISDSHNIRDMTFTIPKSALPTPGTYKFSYSWNSDVTADIDSVTVGVIKAVDNAYRGVDIAGIMAPNHINNAGEFRRDEILIDLKQVSRFSITVRFSEQMSAAGGTFKMRFAITNQTAPEGSSVGYEQSSEDSNFQTAQNTAAIAEAQNETNSKLDQIVQHISDQLFALWNQIAGYLITPWMKQDRDLHDETIDTLEDLDANVTTTIEEQSEWHANFIIEGLKSLFIPSDQYFQTKISEMQNFFEDKLGFLGYTLTYFIRLLNGIMNASQNSVIRFPGIHAPNRATGEDYVLLPAQDVDLGAQISQISEGNFNLLEFCRTAGDIVLVLSFLVLLQDKLREVEQ